MERLERLETFGTFGNRQKTEMKHYRKNSMIIGCKTGIPMFHNVSV